MLQHNDPYYVQRQWSSADGRLGVEGSVILLAELLQRSHPLFLLLLIRLRRRLSGSCHAIRASNTGIGGSSCGIEAGCSLSSIGADLSHTIGLQALLLLLQALLVEFLLILLLHLRYRGDALRHVHGCRGRRIEVVPAERLLWIEVAGLHHVVRSGRRSRRHGLGESSRRGC